MGAHNSRQAPTREVNTVFAFVCEGDTEDSYFEGFQKHVTNLRIHIPPRTNITDPVGLVKHAKTLKSQGYKSNEKDKIICVFDCDLKNSKDEAKKQEKLEKAVKEAIKNKFHICFSNPSFELWFLLHFTKINGEPILTHEILTDKLDKWISNYKKNGDYFDLIYKDRKDAIKNSKSLEEFHKTNNVDSPNGDNIDLVSTKCNPYTSVYKTVEIINMYIDEEDN